jgi:hypothetical protein
MLHAGYMHHAKLVSKRFFLEVPESAIGDFLKGPVVEDL